MQIVVTGADGTIGSFVVPDLRQHHNVVAMDKQPRRPGTLHADLSRYDASWTKLVRGVDAVLHLAGNSQASARWPDLVGDNVDAVVNAYQAASMGGVRRFVFASSNHIMGGYKDQCQPGELKPDLPPKPGTQYSVKGEHRDSTPYACTKLLGERLGQWYASNAGIRVVVVRIGWVKPGQNRWQDIPVERGKWFRQMWLSNNDCAQLLRRALEAPLTNPFVVVNGMSNNSGMPWDIEPTRRLLGYAPVDGATAQ